MYISEATRQALEQGKCMYRESEENEGMDTKILPTKSDWDCCVIISSHAEKVGIRWNPTACDLMADDWQIF